MAQYTSSSVLATAQKRLIILWTAYGAGLVLLCTGYGAGLVLLCTGYGEAPHLITAGVASHPSGPGDGGVGNDEAVNALPQRHGSNILFIGIGKVGGYLYEQGRRSLGTPLLAVSRTLHLLHQLLELFPPLQRP